MKIAKYKKVIIIAGIISIVVIGKNVLNLNDSKQSIIIQNTDVKDSSTNEEEKKDEKYIGTNKEGKKYVYDAKKVEKKINTYDYTNDGEKVVFLTFDDGASTTVTPQILDTLEENDVKATFFITGQTVDNGGQKAKDLVKKEFDSGHAIANHSYSHDYKKLYPNRTLDLGAFKEDFKKTDDLLKDILGENFSTRVLRCPGGFMSWKGMDALTSHLDENNLTSIDWNSLNKDAEGAKKDADQLYQEVVNTAEGKEMVVLLMHDTYGKEQTAKALPKIIKYFKDNGYSFKTLA
ncbi:polysaccharide deacetylase [Romboutsia weinsteinii]|uniref:Polysaccharide deacetylase n=1 Tax=Romboutsia weinsteinii TaxID=2020949 RepID=A0A371J6J1_9FIRM|nr:polysaccharide deacetylase family protein [Romboutsia weinsteinii]RDY28401.1 polysaccharide deacetylase [Romboutsia weinsteinii]